MSFRYGSKFERIVFLSVQYRAACEFVSYNQVNVTHLALSEWMTFSWPVWLAHWRRTEQRHLVQLGVRLDPSVQPLLRSLWLVWIVNGVSLWHWALQLYLYQHDTHLTFPFVSFLFAIGFGFDLGLFNPSSGVPRLPVTARILEHGFTSVSYDLGLSSYNYTCGSSRLGVSCLMWASLICI